jgi:hypothetical protein
MAGAKFVVDEGRWIGGPVAPPDQRSQTSPGNLVEEEP